MKGHEEIERILASYRDARAEERSRADAHVANCPDCAARFASFAEVDAKLAGMKAPAFPAGLSQPLASVLALRESRSATQSPSRFTFARTLVPAAVILFLLVALSALVLSRDSLRTPVTSTPTLTTTLTPTIISARHTAAAGFIGLAPAPPDEGAEYGRALSRGPTPAPVPAPSAGKQQILLAGYRAHATMTH